MLTLESHHIFFIKEALTENALNKINLQFEILFLLLTDKVSKDDIYKVARRLLKSPPSVAARGEVKNHLSLPDIQAGLLDTQGRMPGSRNRLSIFR